MKKYPEYKDSGIEWLGELPKHWNLKRLKFSAQHIVSNVDKKINENEIKVRLCNYTDVYNNDVIEENFPFMEGSVSTNELEKFKLREGDVIITKDSEDPKDIAIPSYVPQNYDDIVCGYHLSVIRRNGKFIGKYIYYVFQSYRFNQQFTVAARGITRFGLSHSSISNATLPIPPFEEQTTITNFLDHKTQQIDDLIERKKRLIELLKEERTAVINQAVTKGLDPNVPMKDSGIEWLGEIPEHWRVKRLKYAAEILFSNVDKKTNEVDPKVLLCNYTDVYNNEFITSDINFMNSTAKVSEVKKFKLIQGDVIITKDSESPDDIAVPAYLLKDIDRLICGYHLAIIRGGSEINSLFLFYLFNSFRFNQQFTVAARGITRFGIGQQSVNNAFIAIPTKTEQEQIAQYLFETTHSLDNSVQNIQQEIKLLQEFKTSIINEAVTGKIDLRNNI